MEPPDPVCRSSASNASRPPRKRELGEAYIDARRVALINQKYAARLTPAEERELDALQERAYRHRARVAPVRNDVLRILFDALEQRSLRGIKSA